MYRYLIEIGFKDGSVEHELYELEADARYAFHDIVQDPDVRTACLTQFPHATWVILERFPAQR